MQRLVAPVLALLLLATAAMEAAARSVRLKDGDRILLGKLLVPDGATLAKGAVLMVHGTLAHLAQETITGVQQAFAERNIPSLAITLSFGESGRTGMYPCTAVHRHKHSNAVREIALWHAWLTRQGAGKVAVFGHSRGGNQVVNYARAAAPGTRVAAIALAPATWSAARADTIYRRRHKRDRLADVEAAAALGDALLEGHPFLSCPNTKVQASSFVDYHRNDASRDTPGLLNDYRGRRCLCWPGGRTKWCPT